MKKYTAIAIAVILLLFVGWLWATEAEAIYQKPDECNQTWEYKSDKGDSIDYEDHRLILKVFNTQAQGNPDSFTVKGKGNYVVEDVFIELDDNNTNGWDVHVMGDQTAFNPTGTDIEEFVVNVRFVCPEPTATPTPTVEPTVTPEPTATPTPVVNKPVEGPAAFTPVCYGVTHPVIPWATAERDGSDALIKYVPTTAEGDSVNVVFSRNPFDIVFNLGEHGLRDHRPNNGHLYLHDLEDGSYWFRIANGCSRWSGIFFIPAR